MLRGPTLTTPACEQAVNTVAPRPRTLAARERPPSTCVSRVTGARASCGVLGGRSRSRSGRDVAAGQKEIGNAVDFRMGDDVATGGLDRFDVGLRGQHREDVARNSAAAMTSTTGREASGMIPVPMRQKQHVDAGQVDGLLARRWRARRRRRGRRQTAPAPCAPPSSGRQCREAVTCHAQLVEAHEQLCPSCWPAGGMLPSRYAISGSRGTPGPMLESVSVALSTTIVTVSSSSSDAAALSGGVLDKSCHGQHQRARP